jgi:DNA mismatch repair protein MutL
VPTIHVLASELATRIAAGEVLERPASAIKELVENALDAGATRCEVTIEGGGVTLLSVADDGHGMSEEDARLAVLRHATSKLQVFEDLDTLGSYGFRGEALPSIASVSRFRLRTRGREANVGTELFIEGGAEPHVQAVGCSVGTTVEVRDLFFNVPARRKFLRSTNTESGHITELLEAMALARPEVTFRLTRDGRKVREWLRVGSRKERAEQLLLGVPLASVQGERGPVTIEAFLAPPERARNGALGLRLIINGRVVRDRAIAATVAQAFGSVLERGRYPLGVVYLDLPARLLDVNVHPQKTEVRFADPRALTDAVYQTLVRALGSAFTPSSAVAPRAQVAASLRGSSGGERWQGSLQSSRPGGSHRAAIWEPPREAPAPPAPGQVERPAASHLPEAESPGPGEAQAEPLRPLHEHVQRAEGGAPEVDARQERVTPLLAVRDSAPSPIRPAADTPWSSLRFVAQLKLTYLLCEGRDALYVLDQHAAAERVLFTRLRHAYQSRQVASQALLFPLSVELGEVELELVERYRSEIREVGFEVRQLGPTRLAIEAIPKLLDKASPERLLFDLLSELGRSGGRGFSGAVELALATMACHGSIRAGDVVGVEEAKALLKALDSADFAGHCPHGRPVLSSMSWAELERKVGRR